MANHQLLFGRPLVADETPPPLSVTGALEGYTSGKAYDSELDINNSVGRCTLTVLESTLPPGARVFIDQLRKKVVVRWDAYTPPVETIQLVPNGDFEAGDDGRWSLGPGWTIGSGEDYPVQDGTHSARFKDYKGTSDMVLASVPAKTNDYIKIDAMIQHGASSEGNVGARVSLVWRDEDGRELDRNWGNYISSGSKGAWKTSTAEGYGPGDASSVQVVVSAKRSRQNHGLFVDKIMWNHQYVLGQNGDDLYFLHIKVADSANRVAYWSGYVSAYVAPPVVPANFLVYSNHLSTIAVYNAADWATPLWQIVTSDGYSRNYIESDPYGLVVLSSNAAVSTLASFDYGVSFAEGLGSSYRGNTTAIFRGRRFIAERSGYLSSSYIVPAGGDLQYIPSPQIRSFLSCEHFLVRLTRSESYPAALSTSYPLNWQNLPISAADSIWTAGCGDPVTGQVAWSVSGSGTANRKFVIVRGLGDVEVRTVPYTTDANHVARVSDAWVVSTGASGLWKVYDDADIPPEQVLPGDVTCVTSKDDGQVVAVTPGYVHYSQDSCSTWTSHAVASATLACLIPDEI